MAKVKITREEDGKQVELEVEQDDVLESDTLVTGTSQTQDEGKPKMFSQEEINALLAKERRSSALKINALQGQYDALLKEVEDGKAAAEETAKSQVTELRKGLPENIGALLDKLTYQEQLSWLQDPKNKIEKKTIPELPHAREGEKPKARTETIF